VPSGDRGRGQPAAPAGGRRPRPRRQPRRGRRRRRRRPQRSRQQQQPCTQYQSVHPFYCGIVVQLYVQEIGTQ
jgi:hypothetical protein